MTAQLTITMSHGFYLLIALSIPFLFLLRRNSISSTRLRYSFTSSPLFHFETLVVQLYSMATFQFDWNKQHSRGVKRIPATKNGCLIMGNSSGGICRREESINRRIGVTGLVCGNRVIFWINKHKSSVSAAGSLGRFSGGLPVDHPRLLGVIVTVAPCTGIFRHQGDQEGWTVATITCLGGTQGVAPVGRSIGAWWRVPRQFDTRGSSTREYVALCVCRRLT